MFLVTDPQVVAHLLWPSSLHQYSAGLAYHPAAQASSHPPRLTARDLLLHNDWLAQLATRKDPLLANQRIFDREVHWGQT